MKDLSSKSNYNGLQISTAESNILFVRELPNDCSRREVGRILQGGDKAIVLCFLEFVDCKCAFTAMEALQGYKFDDRKPDSQTLKIQFAHFPFSPPPDHGEQLTNMHR